MAENKIKRLLPKPQASYFDNWKYFELDEIRLNDNPHIYYSRVDEDGNRNEGYAMGAKHILENYDNPTLEDIMSEISGYEQSNTVPNVANTKRENKIRDIKISLTEDLSDLNLDIVFNSGESNTAQNTSITGILQETDNPSLGHIKNKLPS